MSADRELFNRRELRQRLGSRTNRRSNTKSSVRQTRYNHKTGRYEVKEALRPRPAAQLNQLIEEIKEGN